MNNIKENEENKKKYIKELKEKAAQVKAIVGKYRKRRPIVIEFSGAPKSGKTSSINSLMQFLKRNDFKVKVLSESASICPVKDKHSPMFNIWTACDSIKSLVGELESVRTQYDVIIIDRGIFDAMCWFQWLLDNGKMEHRMKEIMDAFLSMRELVSYIDIVFVYKARPEISIKREYASLLTDISGSIMNEKVLKKYLEAIQTTESVMKDKRVFREIHSIDTSDMNQNDVGKEVTEATLRILTELFEEQIGYVELSEEIKQYFRNEPCISYNQFKNIGGLNCPIQFGKRQVLENNLLYVQLVPIAVFKNTLKEKVLMVKKSENVVRNDSNEKNKILSYVGGHIRKEDVNGENENNWLSICKEALKREVREELGISVSLDNILPDLIYVQDNSRSDIHMAICFLIEMNDDVKLRMESGELLTNRGKGKSGTFISPSEIINEGNSWTRLILKKYFNLVPEQLELFEGAGNVRNPL